MLTKAAWFQHIFETESLLNKNIYLFKNKQLLLTPNLWTVTYAQRDHSLAMLWTIWICIKYALTLSFKNVCIPERAMPLSPSSLCPLLGMSTGLLWAKKKKNRLITPSHLTTFWKTLRSVSALLHAVDDLMKVLGSQAHFKRACRLVSHRDTHTHQTSANVCTHLKARS